MRAITQDAASGETLAAISNLVVGSYAEHVGRGPTKARTFSNENLVVCLTEGAMTKAERVLVSGGHASTVRDTRAMLQESMRVRLIAGVEELTGHRIRACIGGNCLAPDLASALFVLGERTGV
jgi:uncharacterized protein YbcI